MCSREDSSFLSTEDKMSFPVVITIQEICVVLLNMTSQFWF